MMIEENANKVKELDENFLNSIFNDWEQTHQLDPFDIVLYGRYGSPSAIIRRIDGDCGILKPLCNYCRISTREKVKGTDIDILNYIDPEGGPMLTSGIFDYSDDAKVLVYEIYTKGSNIIIFYEVFKGEQKITEEEKSRMYEKLRKITEDMKND